MTTSVADRVKETTTTTGTGTYNLGGAYDSSYQTFMAGVGEAQCYYCCKDTSGWEVGIGTVTDGTPDTLSRDEILGSSNNGAEVNWGSGTKDIFVTFPASVLPSIESAKAEYVADLIHIQDQKTQNTDGGTATSGSWETRDLNTILSDTGDNCTLATNQFTLQPGTYDIGASAPAYYVNYHQIRLYNVTDEVVELLGTSEYSAIISGNAGQTRSVLSGRFTITASKTFRIEHRVNSTWATYGHGIAANLTTEVYTDVFIKKIVEPEIPADASGFIHLQDQKASGTSGGGATSGSWETRDLNTLLSDTGDDCSLSSNQFTLEPGTYDIEISAPALQVDGHKAKLYNITDAADELIGTTEFSASSSATTASNSLVKGQFTISASKTFEVRHRVATTRAVYGYGNAATLGSIEVYTEVKLWKKSPLQTTTVDEPGLIILQDQKSQNTAGGTATTGSWEVRDLTVLVVDTDDNCALSSNQFTLDPGTYDIEAQAPGYRVGGHQIKLYNVTDSADVIIGMCAATNASDQIQTAAALIGRFTITASKTFEIRHRVGVTSSTNGHGIPSNFDTETYTTVRLQKKFDVTSPITASRDIIHIQDQKAQGTDAGASTATTVHTRTLNTIVSDTGGHCSLATNQFTLAAGTYDIKASAPAYLANQHQIKLYNITDSLTELWGTAEYSTASTGGQTRSVIIGRLILDVSKTFEIRHYITSAKASNGLGVSSNQGTEIYTDVILEKIPNKLVEIEQPGFIHIQDQKASGTEGGAATSGASQIRTLNTILSDPQDNVTLSSNQFTLQPGTYDIEAKACAYKTNRTRLQLYNITDATTDIQGENAVIASSDATSVWVSLSGRFTLSVSKTFEIRQANESAQATNGLGRADSRGEEIYCDVKLWKIFDVTSPVESYSYIHIQDQKTSGTGGGTGSTGSWLTRDLNTILSDTGDDCSLTSNQFTLAAGTYEIEARAPAYKADQHALRLRNVTDGVTTLLGNGCYSSASLAVETWVFLRGRFTIHVTKTFEIQHQVAYSLTNNLGSATALQTEVYTDVKIRKILTEKVIYEAPPYIQITDIKTGDAYGGTSAAATWNIRDLNTLEADTGGHCSVASNRFTLDAGTYEYRAEAPAYACGDTKLALYDYTNSAYIKYGTNNHADQTNLVGAVPTVQGRFSVSVETTFELHHWTQLAQTNSGLGTRTSSSTIERFATIELRKVG